MPTLPEETTLLALLIELPTIEPELPFKEAKQKVVDAFELAYLRALLSRHDDNITRSANAAGLTRYHLRELIKRHHLAGRAQQDPPGEE